MKRIRYVFQAVSFVLFIACIFSIFSSNSAKANETKAPGSLTEEEKRIKNREEELDKKIKEMERIRAEVSGELEKQKKEHEEHLVKLVSVYETMTPKSAAAVFESMDDFLAVDLLKRMDIKKVAKIMNLLNKERSAKLSALLTGYYRPSSALASTTNSGQGQAVQNSALPNSAEKKAERTPASQKESSVNPTKGGEKKDDQQSSRSRKGSS